MINRSLKTAIVILLAFSQFASAQKQAVSENYLSSAEVKLVAGADSEKVPEILREAISKNSEQLLKDWIVSEDKGIRARLAQGDEDSIVNLLLFGTSFTSQPRISTAQIIKSATSGSKDESQTLQSFLQARLDDFVSALQKAQPNERLSFAKSHLFQKLKIKIIDKRSSDQVKQFLIESLQRVLNETEGYANLIRQAQMNASDVFVTRSQLFSKRGLSSDTSLKPNFGIEKAITELKANGNLTNIHRVAIIGPGLDFTDKEEGYDFYPPQTIQPFAVIESLQKLGLSEINSLTIDTYDLSPKVNAHIASFASLAKNGGQYHISLPMDLQKKLTPEFLTYWRKFGSTIASSLTRETALTQLGLIVREVSIGKNILSLIKPHDTNIIVESPTMEEKDRYDLIIGTNIFLYYNSFEQGLTMINLNKMLKNGGILLSNNALIEFPFTPIHSFGYTKAIYSQRPGDADAIVWYKKVG